MNRTIILSSLATLSVFALVGCAPKETTYVPKPEKLVAEAELKSGEEWRIFPFVEGNQWVYKMEASRKNSKSNQVESVQSELTLRCTKAQKIGKVTNATIEVIIDGKINEVQRWRMDEKGLYQVSVGSSPVVPFTPPQPAILFPLEADRKFEWRGSGYTPVGTAGTQQQRTAGVVQAKMQVDTGVGRMEAWPVQQTMSWAKGVQASMSWWTPDVGLVRYRMEATDGDWLVVNTMRLIAKTLKDENGNSVSTEQPTTSESTSAPTAAGSEGDKKGKGK
jgi:hypothetical protein